MSDFIFQCWNYLQCPSPSFLTFRNMKLLWVNWVRKSVEFSISQYMFEKLHHDMWTFSRMCGHQEIQDSCSQKITSTGPLLYQELLCSVMDLCQTECLSLFSLLTFKLKLYVKRSVSKLTFQNHGLGFSFRNISVKCRIISIPTPPPPINLCIVRLTDDELLVEKI